MQTDPIGYQDQMNLYAYVANDPMNATDPIGRDTWTLGVEVDGGVGALFFSWAGGVYYDDKTGDFGFFSTTGSGYGIGGSAGVTGSYTTGTVDDFRGTSHIVEVDPPIKLPVPISPGGTGGVTKPSTPMGEDVVGSCGRVGKTVVEKAQGESEPGEQQTYSLGAGVGAQASAQETNTKTYSVKKLVEDSLSLSCRLPGPGCGGD